MQRAQLPAAEHSQDRVVQLSNREMAGHIRVRVAPTSSVTPGAGSQRPMLRFLRSEHATHTILGYARLLIYALDVMVKVPTWRCRADTETFLYTDTWS